MNLVHHVVAIWSPPERVFEALTTTEGGSSWWTTEARGGGAASGALLGEQVRGHPYRPGASTVGVGVD